MLYLSIPRPPASIAIILNGQPEALTRLQAYWQQYQQIVICDGAWSTAEHLSIDINHHNDLSHQSHITVLGDGDSLINKPPSFIYYADQDSTDFEKALKYILDNIDTTESIHPIDVDVYWGNGGELDHTLGNLAVACRYHSLIHCHFFTDSQYYCYINIMQSPLVRIHHTKQKTLSLFPFPQCTIEQSEGLLYPMHEYAMSQYYQQSLRNQLSDKLATIKFTDLTGEAIRPTDGCFIFIER